MNRISEISRMEVVDGNLVVINPVGEVIAGPAAPLPIPDFMAEHFHRFNVPVVKIITWKDDNGQCKNSQKQIAWSPIGKPWFKFDEAKDMAWNVINQGGFSSREEFDAWFEGKYNPEGFL